jgi:hypothetical protein
MSLAQEALDKAEELDGYHASCAASALNTAARRNQIYAPSFLDHANLQKLYKCMFEVPLVKTMNVVVLNSSADNGYPHTRPHCVICMPKSNILSMSPDKLKNTLCHEAIHVHQRRNPELWASVCRKDGWTPVGTKKIPYEFMERCRLNPDTFRPQRFWAWEAYHVPMPLFVREDNPTLGDIQVKWLDLRNETLFADPPSSFVRRYGSAPPQPEHPFELLAVEGAHKKLYTEELLLANLNTF